MKRIIYILLFILAIVACKKSGDFLDNKANTSLNEAVVFSDSARTMLFLARIYQDAGFSFFKGRWDSHGNTEQATDDAEYAYSGVGQKAVILYNGTVSPLNFPFTEFWNLPYANIRRVNLLLQKLPETPLSAGMQKRVAAEARFLRAYYYHHLITCFGGVPLVNDEVYGIDDIINLPRNTYEDCVSYIANELDAAGTDLPKKDDYPEQDYGRASRGACQALKARVLLYAASPLFNGGAETTDGELKKLVSYADYNVSRWQAAADAADAVISSGEYNLMVDNTTAPGYGFFNVFLRRVNPEYIFAFHRAANRDMEVFYNPPSRGGQKNSQPTHNLVSSFPMKNGKMITDPASGYDPTQPYQDRDPRFGYSIIYNGSLYYSTTGNTKTVVNTYFNAPTDGYSPTGATTTGYFSRKMCDDNISANSSFNTERGWPLIRYAEILLNYAEAINETGQTTLAYEKIIQLRHRAGIDPGPDDLYGLEPGMTKEQMREVIRNERRIELAFEDHRWHDIRRWKIAMVVNNAFNKAMKVNNLGGGNFSYEIVETIRRHNFRPEMYLLPIPDGEIRKMPAVVQNPGW